MIALVFVVLAVVGTLARVLISARFNDGDYPVGTLTVNVVGAFLIGLLASASPDTATVLGTGALGSFTTFSTLSHECVHMCRRQRITRGAGYLALTVVLGVAAAWVGLTLAG